jgi:pimeloyl-ACP methyl ester carboxylesterase
MPTLPALLLRAPWLLILWIFAVPLQAASDCGPDRPQASGAVYRICMPDPQDYNGRLVVFAHGFQDAGTPVGIPENQLRGGTVDLPDLVNSFGFGFAITSYSKTGLAVRQGMADILDLVRLYTAEQGAPQRVYLTGASEGGLITTLLIEQHPEVFSAGLAACGPVGNFPLQINYFGDARATFEYFFPGLIPGDPFDPPADLAANWASFYETTVEPQVFASANRAKLRQWFKVAKLPYDKRDPQASMAVTTEAVLRYAVVNLHDASATLGGFPFDNTGRGYRGSRNDPALNRAVARVTADPAALEAMNTLYTPNGRPARPLVTLHNTLDPQVPYPHETLYRTKTRRNGLYPKSHFNFRIARFGHCRFTENELLLALATMILYADDRTAAGTVTDKVGLGKLRTLLRLARKHQVPASLLARAVGG